MMTEFQYKCYKYLMANNYITDYELARHAFADKWDNSKARGFFVASMNRSLRAHHGFIDFHQGANDAHMWSI